MSIRVSVLVAAAVVVLAAVITLDPVAHPLKNVHFYSGVILAASVAIQRMNGVQSWLVKPRSSRISQIELFAQQTLLNLCEGRTVDRELTELCIHVWEVPLWYRRAFPYQFRVFLRRRTHIGSPDSTRWIPRPTLNRVAATALMPRPPSGISFRKGIGLVGLCIASNDRTEYLTLNIASAEYRNALNVASEAQWRRLNPKLTHNLPLADALKLSRSYGQIIGKVVQDVDSGEAIGCVTVSVKTTSAKEFNFKTDIQFRKSVTDLSVSVALILA
jgi:hypothetical protein